MSRCSGLSGRPTVTCLPSDLQVLRSHVMVRVGGGWDTLEHYLDKHDPCRCSSSGRCLVGGSGPWPSGPVSEAPPSPGASIPTAHRLPPQRAGTFSPQRGSPTPSPRPGSPVPGSERRGSRPEVTPISLRSTKEGPEVPLR